MKTLLLIILFILSGIILHLWENKKRRKMLINMKKDLSHLESKLSTSEFSKLEFFIEDDQIPEINIVVPVESLDLFRKFAEHYYFNIYIKQLFNNTYKIKVTKNYE